MAQLFPQIEQSDPRLIREMVWRELGRHGEAGSTVTELAADLLATGRTTGTREECEALLASILNELAGGFRVRRSERGKFVALGASA